MGSPLTESPVYTSTVAQVSDGDLANAVTFTSPLQSLANRTAYFHNLVDVTGVKRIQTFSDTSALRAYTGQASGDYASVGNRGLFRFYSGSPPPDDGVTVIVPTVGGGYWVMVAYGYGSLDLANGVPQLGSDAKLAASKVHGALLGVSLWVQNLTVTVDPIGSTSQLVTGYSNPLSLTAGDVVLVSGYIEATGSVNTHAIYWTLGVNGTGTNIKTAANSGTDFQQYALCGVYTAASTATYTFQIRVSGNSGLATLNAVQLNFARFSSPT